MKIEKNSQFPQVSLCGQGLWKCCIKYPFQLGDVLVIVFQGVFFQTKLNSIVWNKRVKLMPENGVSAESC